MTKKVYWASIEYIYTPESNEFNKLKGGFVYAFVNADNFKIALDKIKKEMDIIHLESIHIEFIKPYDKDTKWKTSEETAIYMDLFNESQKSNQVVFDTFYAYEKK
jgi:hypothetical protein